MNSFSSLSALIIAVVLSASICEKALAEDNQSKQLWHQLEALAEEGRPFLLELDQQTYQMDEMITMYLQLPIGALGRYLTVLSVDSEDLGVVLYPNRYSPTPRQVNQAHLEFPKDLEAFHYFAIPPEGDDLVVAILTDQPIELNQEYKGFDNRNGTFDINGVFSLFTEKTLNMLQNMLGQGSGVDFYAASFVATVKP